MEQPTADDPYAPPTAELAEPDLATSRYFVVGQLKLAVLSLCTLGLYELWWFYKNWVCIRDRARPGIMPFWRAFFAALWGFSLAAFVRDELEAEKLSGGLPPVLIGGLYLAASVLSTRDDAWWLLTFLTFIPLLWIQSGMSAVVIAHDEWEGTAHTRAYNVANWFAIVIGGALFVLAVAGTFIPDEMLLAE